MYFMWMLYIYFLVTLGLLVVNAIEGYTVVVVAMLQVGFFKSEDKIKG
jgi:hypothetical protein